MAIDSADDLKTTVGNLLGTAWTELSEDSQDAAVAAALDELSYSIPLTNQRQCYWLVERTKRHGLYVVVVSQAERFKYKQINLQQKFDHYFKIIEKADATFAKAVETDISGVFSLDIADSTTFAKYGFMNNPAGFVYDQLGRDLTYVYNS